MAGNTLEAQWSVDAPAPGLNGNLEFCISNEMNRLVRILAARVLARLPGNSGIEMADLVQAGNVGLLQASRTYSPNTGAHLAGYARFRIRGEMLDTVRRHTNRNAANVVIQGSTADDGSDLEGMIPAPLDHSPHSILSRNERQAILDQEVDRLPVRYRTVVRLRYAKDCSLREIGDRLNVHESRACQLHRSALCRLKRALARRGVRNISMLM
jgi:RNA polymerase sigma factor FliA